MGPPNGRINSLSIKAKVMGLFTASSFKGERFFLAMRKYLKIYFTFVASAMYMDHVSPITLFWGILASPLFLGALLLQKLEEISFFKD
jgi:hypothetical protein